ncbi:MAG: phosphotransferase [Candidatus Magasanikbacteria bacterium]
MKKYSSIINKIKKKFEIPQEEKFLPANSGTHYKVFLSKNYVIRFHENNPELLNREVVFLKTINHSLIPKILFAGKIDGLDFMVENRLPGETLNTSWKILDQKSKLNIAKQIVSFIRFLRNETGDNVYSIKNGKKYNSFQDCILDGIAEKISKLKKNKQLNKVLKDLITIIEDEKNKKVFIDNKITLVHGDLINHNLLIRDKKLTGVLDWELAMWGDPDYDISRLFYYQECARAYYEQGIDETFEADFIDTLATTIMESNLMEDKEKFWIKHRLLRAIFYINSLYWALNSSNQRENFEEIINLWEAKKERVV